MAFTPYNAALPTTQPVQPQVKTGGFTPYNASMPVTPTSQAPVAQPPVQHNSVIGPQSDFNVGVYKGLASTLKGIGQVGSDILDNTLGRAGNIIAGNGNVALKPISPIYDSSTPEAQKANEALTATNTVQKIGKGAEQIGEFFLPGGLANKGEEAINLLSKGIQSPILAATTRVAGKGLVQGVAAAGVKLAQTGGDIKSSLETGATAGLIRGGLAIIGEGSNALKIPERLYSTIFKNSSGDMLQQLKSGGIEALQRDNPEKFQQFVDSGIIKLGNNGAPIINESLAKQALDAGLRGSTRTMADTLVAGTLDSEHAAQQVAQGYKGTIAFPEKQFIGVLDDVAAQYKDVGFGEVADEAQRLSESLKASNGELSADDALSMRRLLDKLRISSSFNTPAPKLSLTQANFKTLADAARQRVNAIPGMQDVMTKYSFNINALEALAKDAARAGNNQVLSLIDSVFLSGGLTSGNVLPATSMAVVRKYLATPGGITRLGSLLNQVGGAASTPLTGTIGAISGAGQ